MKLQLIVLIFLFSITQTSSIMYQKTKNVPGLITNKPSKLSTPLWLLLMKPRIIPKPKPIPPKVAMVIPDFELSHFLIQGWFAVISFPLFVSILDKFIDKK